MISGFKLPSPLPLLRARRGVALIMAIATLALLTYFAMEVTYDSTVEYTVNSQGLNRLKAYYAARAGLEIGLMRIKVYQTIQNQFGQDLAKSPYAAFIDEIWRFPFAWPLPIPKEMNSVDSDEAKKLEKESLMDASFSMDIQDEGSRLDLGDLISSSKTLREGAHKRLVDVLKNKTQTDPAWQEKYSSTQFDQIVNNIADWMSEKNSSLNGGDKKSAYAEMNKDREYFPPNRGFRTLQEMRLVKDMNDDFFDLIAPQVTIYGMRGVNPNVASREVLKSLDPGIDDRVAEEIEKRRNDPEKGGPFKDADEFWKFVTDAPASARLQNEDAKKIPLSFEGLVSFRVIATGEFGTARRQIEVIVTDLDRTASKIKEFVDKDKQPQQSNPAAGNPNPGAPNPNGGAPGTTKSNKPLPKGPPRIVYWSER